MRGRLEDFSHKGADLGGGRGLEGGGLARRVTGQPTPDADGAAVPAVDLVVNVFERSYRARTAPGAFAALASSHRFPFARKMLLVNNVEDPEDARRRAERVLESGEADEVHFVAERLGQALEACGLRRAELGRVLHFCDAPLVAVTLPGSPWLLYWDADATLDVNADWIAPSCAKLAEDPRLLIANPSWERPLADGSLPAVEHETVERDGDFAVGHGFSDQAFLVRRAELAAPIYRTRCLVALTHPRAHKAPTFEARVNSHMRHHGRLRATYLPVSYSIDQPSGADSRRPVGAGEWARYVRNGALLRAARVSPWQPACLRHTWIGASPNGAGERNGCRSSGELGLESSDALTPP